MKDLGDQQKPNNQSPVKLNLSERDSSPGSVYSSLGISANDVWDGKNFDALLKDTLDYYDLLNYSRQSLIPYYEWAIYGDPQSTAIISEHDFQRRNRIMYSLAALGEYVARRGGRVLNLGCGCGCDSLPLAMMGAQVMAVDGTQSAIALAREVTSATKLANQVALYHSETKQFLQHAIANDLTFEAIVCAFSLSGMPDLTETFKFIARLLRPGGYLYIADSPPMRSSLYQNGRLHLVQQRILEERTFQVLKTYFQDDETNRYIGQAMMAASLQVVYSSRTQFPQDDYYAETIGRVPTNSSEAVLPLNDARLSIYIDRMRSGLAVALSPLCKGLLTPNES